LKRMDLSVFDPDSDKEINVFFPLSAPAGKPTKCRIVFNAPTTFATDVRCNILIYDIKGRLVRTIVRGEKFQASHYDYDWDGKDVNQQYLPCGIYIISVELADQDTGNIIKSQAVVAIGRKL
ncbi:MAG: hypothetical protein COT16_03615, partial [Elusimicrobia bacterium CG08_land_8_20_14_0_20_44_26]